MTSPNLPPRICVESDNLRSLLDATRLPHLDTGRTRRALGRWVVLPRLDQFGPWPKRAGRYAARQNRDRLDPVFADDDAALPYYFRKAREAWATADEERTRRLALEAEFAACSREHFNRPAPEVRYVERKVYAPMPPREVIKKITIDRCAPMAPSIVVTPPEVQAAPALGFFGRVGAKIDNRLRRRTIHVGMGR